jgi:hypothetical protein
MLSRVEGSPPSNLPMLPMLTSEALDKSSWSQPLRARAALHCSGVMGNMAILTSGKIYIIQRLKRVLETRIKIEHNNIALNLAQPFQQTQKL